ncbi:MAG: hypothetical protein JKY19_06595 [Alcanivoracaceae bacterium]|nr:hypothetical protein [Alcanivoracaceae bacterium]
MNLNLKFNVSHFFLSCLLILLVSNSLHAQVIPDDLKQWQAWVEFKQEFYDCPYYYNQKISTKFAHVCAWPHALNLSIKDNNAQFNIHWNIIQDSWIPLPGDKHSWPMHVKINQKNQIIQRQNNRPRIYLKKGSYDISGEFSWIKRPESIEIPLEIAGINLSVDENTIDFPQRKGYGLWLGENNSSKKVESNEIEFEVNRLIIDGHPMRMYVVLNLYVSGNARNEKLGKIANEQLQVTSIDGDVSTYIDKEGYLWAQLKPGQLEISVSFNILDWPSQIPFQAQGEFWPQQEIWAYQDDKNIRITQIKGVQPINPQQSFSQWDEVPNFLVNSGDVFEVHEQKRGTLNQTAQLNLYRTLWLSFDGGSFRSTDEIVGDKLGSWRLNGIEGYQLLNAKDHDESMLITQSEDGSQGLELHTPEIYLQVNAEFNPSLLTNISPWQASFDKIKSDLYLPYGYLPLAASNVDSSRGIWIEKWKLWDIFIVMLLTAFCFKVLGLKTSIAAFFTLILGYHESHMPLIAWANIIIGVALLSIKPNGKIRILIRSYVIISTLALFMVLTPFLITQVRLSIHPQLESRLDSAEFHYSPAKKPARDRNRLEEISQQNIQSYNTANAIAEKKSFSQLADDVEELDSITVTGSHITNRNLINRYQTGAILQAGKGTPQWRTNPVSLSWDGPISTNQQFKLFLLPPLLRTMWRLLLVFSSIAWLLFVLKKLTRDLSNVKTAKITTALLFLVFFFPTITTAQNYPPNNLLKELHNRLYQEVECKTNCASIEASHVMVNASDLQIQLHYHAFEDVVVDIPYSKDWRIEKIIINGTIQPARIIYKNRPWINIPKGINTVHLIGTIADRNNISILFPLTPGSITADSKGWQIAGIDNKLLSNNTLQLISTIQDISDSKQTKRTDIKPFVHVSRFITFDDNWSVITSVNRIASNQGALNLSIPLLKNEHPTEKMQYDSNGEVIISMGPTESSFSWTSRMDRNTEMTLTAADNEYYLETWEILASPQWNINISGVPIVTPTNIIDSMNDYFVHIYKPRPGESLLINISRPQAIEGNIVSIESINNHFSIGKRATKSITTIHYRATQGGAFDINLDKKAQVNSVSFDGADSNLTNEDGVISVGFLPGKHKVIIEWQVNQALSSLNTTPMISIAGNYSNIRQKINIPNSRWVLYGYSKGVGPAFLYWGEFLVFTVLAFFLARIAYSPLKFWQWLLLGYAFGTVSWFAFGFISMWLFFVGWKKQQQIITKDLSAILLQWFSLLLTVITIIVFIASVAFGLLSYPQMGITGQGSNASNLNWFMDVYQNQLPAITIISLPIWWYKGLMLMWSIWVSFSLLDWLQQLLKSFDKSLWWKPSKSIPKQES